MSVESDDRVVMTLDAGGTNLRFAAVRGGRSVTETISMSSSGDNLERCLADIVEGFSQVRTKCPAPPVATGTQFRGQIVSGQALRGLRNRKPGGRVYQCSSVFE